MSVKSSHWAVAIFAARETPAVLARTVSAAVTACLGRQATIDVLINGNQALATSFSELAPTISTGECTVRVWWIPTPDKANAWNQYVHRIWDTGGIAFCVDGYARAKPNAFDVIDRHLSTTPTAMAASGVPTCGRSAKRLREKMLGSGGIHGNLYALPGTSMKALRAAGFRLPLGLYRTDSMLGAALTFRLDPAKSRWTRGSVVAVAGATWDVDGISGLSYMNVISYIKRRFRQAHGLLESRAFRDHMAVKRLPLQSLPETAQTMVKNWLAAEPAQARSLFLKQPSCLYAARQLRTERDWSAEQVEAVLLHPRTGDGKCPSERDFEQGQAIIAPRASYRHNQTDSENDDLAYR